MVTSIETFLSLTQLVQADDEIYYPFHPVISLTLTTHTKQQ